MQANWQIIESGFLTPEAIMAKDADFLAQLDPNGPPILHLYDWNAPCLTFGYFTDPARHLNLDAMQEYGLKQARRPTGGGIIFHLTDLAFSILLPASHPHFSINTLENYAFINAKVATAIARYTSHLHLPQLLDQEPLCSSQECHAFCMAKPTQYDLMLNGRKVGGAAQRRTKQGLLHQGSLSLLPPPLEVLQNVLKNGTLILDAMQHHSQYLLPHEAPPSHLIAARQQIRENLKQVLCN